MIYPVLPTYALLAFGFAQCRIRDVLLTRAWYKMVRMQFGKGRVKLVEEFPPFFDFCTTPLYLHGVFWNSMDPGEMVLRRP